MILEGTKQLRNFKKGINLYVPQRRIVSAVPGSLLFNDPNQFLQFPRSEVISILAAEPFTIEAWIRPTSIKTIATLDANGNPDPLDYGDIIIGDTEGGGNNWSLQLFNNKLTFYRYKNAVTGFKFFTSNTQISLNAWTHVAVSYDGGSTLLIFINGELDRTFVDYSPPDTQYSVITIGNLFNTGTLASGDGAYAYKGYITNLRINDNQIFYHMVSPFEPTAPLGHISGTTLLLLANTNDPTKDSSPGDVTITNVGSVASSAQYPTVTDCANNDAKVLMVGWYAGARPLTRDNENLYTYYAGGSPGDETVYRANSSSPWIYTNVGIPLATSSTVSQFPWQAVWPSPYTATKVCPKAFVTNSRAFNSSGGEVASITGNIPANWVDSQSTVTSVIFANDNSVTSIGDRAFNSCNGLTSITIPNSVTSISAYAFQNCGNVSSVTFTATSSVTSIGYSAFLGCETLATITIPNSVTSIGAYAFQNCANLTTATIGNSVTSIGNYTFKSSGLTSIVIPNSVTSIGSYAFQFCTGLTSVTIPSSVTSIGNYAFANCTSLATASIGTGVTSIGSYAFANCTSLATASIGTGVTSIGSSAFRDAGLTSIVIPNSVTSIGGYAFNNCSDLTTATIGNSVTSIGAYAFSYTGLTSITIPNSVTSIATYAFAYNSSLTTVTIGTGVTSISAGAFGYSNVATINCYTTSTAFGSYGLSNNLEEQLTIHARTTDGTWTASNNNEFDQSIAGGNLIRVIKDLT